MQCIESIQGSLGKYGLIYTKCGLKLRIRPKYEGLTKEYCYASTPFSACACMVGYKMSLGECPHRSLKYGTTYTTGCIFSKQGIDVASYTGLLRTYTKRGAIR